MRWLKRLPVANRPAHLPPRVEVLEDRTLLSITLPTPGMPGPLLLTGTAGADQLLLRLEAGNTGNLQVSDDGGVTFQTAALADVTRIDVDGRGGRDVLTLDHGNGLVAKTGGLTINYEGGAGRDELDIVGDPGTTVSEVYSLGINANTGALTETTATALVTVQLVHVGGILDTSTAANLKIAAINNRNLLRLRNGPIVNGVITNRVLGLDVYGLDAAADALPDLLQTGDEPVFVTSTYFLPYTFANKTNVLLDAFGGDDLVRLMNTRPAAGLASLTVDGGAGTDRVFGRGLPAGVSLNVTNVEALDRENPAAVFIQELYEQRLQRSASDAEVVAWAGLLGLPNGRFLIADGIERSREARTRLVKTWYETYLGRPANNGEEQGWVNALVAGATEEATLAAILGSPEFLLRASSLNDTGASEERFLRTLYRVLLNRVGSDAEIAGWLSAVSRFGRAAVAGAFLHSQEYRFGVVTGLYAALLHRPADASALQTWATSNVDLTRLRIAFQASDEFNRNG